MRRSIKQEMGLSFEMLMCILVEYDKELSEDNVTKERKRMILISTGNFVILFAGALRGGEVFALEASDFVKRRDNERNLDKNGHVVVPLMGQFINETGECNLVIVLTNEIDGGLSIRKWVSIHCITFSRRNR